MIASAAVQGAEPWNHVPGRNEERATKEGETKDEGKGVIEYGFVRLIE